MYATDTIEYKLDSAYFAGPQLSTKALSSLISHAENALYSWLQLNAPTEISRLAFNIELLKNSPLTGIDNRPAVIELINQLTEMDELS